MSSSNSNVPELNKMQIKADIVIAESALNEAKKSKPKLAKYLKGQVGYHLQQAAEKLIKIQIYRSGVAINHSRLYKHDLQYMSAIYSFIEVLQFMLFITSVLFIIFLSSDKKARQRPDIPGRLTGKKKLPEIRE